MRTPRQYQNPAHEAALHRDFRLRLAVTFIFIVLLFGVLLARFIYLQVFQHEEFTAQATTNRITLIPTAPIRGEIVDANGVVLAHNYPAYSLEIVPNQIEGKLDDTIEALKAYVELTDGDLRRFKKFRAEFRAYENIPLKIIP